MWEIIGALETIVILKKFFFNVISYYLSYNEKNIEQLIVL